MASAEYIRTHKGRLSRANLVVATYWARQENNRWASGNGNVRVDGRVLYSYRTPIAALHPARNHPAGMIALVTTERYSVTTEGKHKNAAWHALRAAGVPSFQVPVVWPAMGGEPEMHELNAASLWARIQDCCDRIASRKAGYGLYEYETEAPAHAMREYERYCEAFGLTPRSTSEAAEMLAAAWEKRHARLADYEQPHRVEARIRARAKRDLMRLVEGRANV